MKAMVPRLIGTIGCSTLNTALTAEYTSAEECTQATGPITSKSGAQLMLETANTLGRKQL